MWPYQIRGKSIQTNAHLGVKIMIRSVPTKRKTGAPATILLLICVEKYISQLNCHHNAHFLFAKGCETSSKSLCPTRWAVRTAAIDVVLKDGNIHSTMHDEYGLKVPGFLHSLEILGTHFGLMLAHTVFSAS